MPCLSGAYNPARGVILQVGILPGGTLPNAKNQKPVQAANSFKVHMLNGMVDTGADKTCISSKAAQSIQISPVSKITVQGATGSNQMNQYRIDLLLQFGKQSLAMSNFLAVEYSSNSTLYDVLIGRDILCKGVLTMDFSGHFSFSI